MPRRPMRPNEVSSGGVVFRRGADGVEVCLVNDGRYWGFPKGLIEPGETPEVAALREISEETGLVPEVLMLRGPLPLTEYVYRRRDSGALIFKRVHHFLVEAPAGTELHPDSAEIAEAAWLRLGEARRRLSFKNTYPIIDAARDLLADTEPQGEHSDAP
jgi:8-oxo-dGTP pyrophosphatase MutT (NUDIX family)